MITNVDKQTKNIIQAGLSYWADMLSSQTASKTMLQKESSNIQNLIFYGSKVDDTWQETAVLALKLSPYIETKLSWQEWIPTIKDLLNSAPSDQVQMKLQLMIRLGALYRLSGQTKTAIQIHESGLDLARELAEPIDIGRVHHQLASNHMRLGNYETANEHALQAKEYFEQDGDAQYLADILHDLATLNRVQANSSLAEQQIREALKLYRADVAPLSTAKSYYELGNILEQQKRPHEATDAYEIAETLFLKTDNLFDLSRLYIGWGTLHHNLKEYAEADRIFQKADRAYLINSGHRWLLAYLENNMGSNLLTMGDVFTAVPYLYRAVGHFEAVGNLMMRCISLGMLARANGLEGKVELAIEQYSEAITYLEENNAVGFFKNEMLRFIEEKKELEKENGKG